MKRRWKNLIVAALWVAWFVWTIYAISDIRPGWLAITMIMLMLISTFLITASLTIINDANDW